jgi:hypothetical protein
MRAFARVLLLFGSFVLVVSAGPAEAKSNGRIAGNIKSLSGSPLRDAVIKIFEEVHRGEVASIARSDNRGFFKSANLTPGTYYLQVTRPGFQPVTTNSFKLDSGRTVSLEIILQDFLGYISNDEDPRNWDLKTVMRSSSDRRLIFRNSPGNSGVVQADTAGQEFYRSGSMSVASGTGQNYFAHPQTSPNGVSSSFAYSEPVSPHSRMIFSGQLDFGSGAFWRVRNTYNYRPDSDHDFKASVGYGRQNMNYPGNIASTQLLSQESSFNQSRMETIAVGIEANTKFFDLLAVQYGFDYARLHYGNDKSFFYPSVQILITPVQGWNFKTSFTSRRISEAESVVLPDGEFLNLAEPTLITMVGNQLRMSQIRHSEIAVQRNINPDTAVEFAVYRDQMQGAGLPLMVTASTSTERRTNLIEMNEDHSSQNGMRVSLNRNLLDFLSGSLAYVYGSAASVSDLPELVSNEGLERNLLKLMKRQYYHSINGQIDARLPTRTNLLATVRWYPGNPLTPIDWFSDRMDIGTKSVNFEVRQAIPVPEFMGTTGRWEILVDLRNMLNQGKEVLPTAEGEIVLNRNPRSMRFGLNINFH